MAFRIHESVVRGEIDNRTKGTAPEWRLTPEENERRAKEAAAALTGFMQRLGEAFEAQEQREADSGEDSDGQE